jgi:uncharacterized protein YrrD
MLLPIEQLTNLPVMSLQTGTELARTTSAIIDPRGMKIVAFYVDGPLLETHPSVLHPEDIRELSDIGFIVDNSERLMPLDGLVRLQTIIDLNFELIGMKVIDEHKRKLGKVIDYVVEPDGFTIQQLSTQQPLLRSLSTATHLIRRSQIIAVRKDAIVVKGGAIKEKAEGLPAQAARTLVNPFRDSQPESVNHQSH